MTDFVYIETLKPMNESVLTGLETLVCSDRLANNMRVNIYKDNYNQYRITVKNVTTDDIMSGILFDNKRIIRFKYTKPAYRGNKYTKQLFAYIEYKLKKRFFQSDNMTVAGLASA